MQVRDYKGTEISGWFTPDQGRWLHDQIKELRAVEIALIGIYRGLNLSYIVDTCKRNDVRIHAVDIWEKAGDNLDGKSLSRLALWGFRRQLKKARLFFDDWIEDHKLTDHVSVIHQSSVDAAAAFEDSSLDFIFLDADHGYDSVLQDLGVWYGKLKEEKMFAGDDWVPAKWPGLVTAVEEFSEARGLTPKMEGDRLWSFRRRS